MGFKAEDYDQMQPDPRDYWKPNVGDIVTGWHVWEGEAPNNFFQKDKPFDHFKNNDTQPVSVIWLDESPDGEGGKPIIIYWSNPVLRRLFEKGPDKGDVRRRLKIGDHFLLKRVPDAQPTVKGFQGMKQFYMRIDPEPPATPLGATEEMKVLAESGIVSETGQQALPATVGGGSDGEIIDLTPNDDDGFE